MNPKTPFQKQLGWHPAPDDDSLIQADRIFIKHGYAPSPQTIEYLHSLKVERVLVRGLQTSTCCLAAGFALFDGGQQPRLITDLTGGSSLNIDEIPGLAVHRLVMVRAPLLATGFLQPHVENGISTTFLANSFQAGRCFVRFV